MSRTSAPNSRRAGFTLIEVALAAALATMVFAAIFSAYLYIGRNLTRLANTQHQEAQSRRTLQQFVQDISAASTLTRATSTELVLTKPTSSGTSTVSYVYSSGDGTLTRTDAAGPQTLLSGATGVTLSYFSESGLAVSDTQSVKAVELLVSTANGSAASGTRSGYTSASSRVVLRNKAPLQ